MSNRNIKYFECTCSSEEHILRVIYFKGSKKLYDQEVYVHKALISHKNIFKRIWVAIKYICGYKCMFGTWEETCLNEDQIRELIDFLKKPLEEWESYRQEKP